MTTTELNSIPEVEGSRPTACLVCGAETWERVFADLADNSHVAEGAFDVWRCRDCGVGRTWPVADDTSAYYREEPLGAADRTSLSWRLRYLACRMALALSLRRGPAASLGRGILSRAMPISGYELSRFAPARSFSLLDVGSGSATLLGHLRRLGLEIYGVGRSERAVGHSRDLGLECRVGAIEDLPYPPERFDVVRFAHSLGGLSDPRTALGAARRLLRPGGRLVIRAQAWDSLQAEVFGPAWQGLDIPREVWHFTASSLDRILTELGFRVLWSERLSYSRFVASWGRSLAAEGHDRDVMKRVAAAYRDEVDEIARQILEAGEGDEWFIVADKPGREYDDAGSA